MNSERHLIRSVTLVATLLAAACAPTAPEDVSLYPQSAPVEAPVTHAVRFAPNNETLSAAEGAALAAFLRSAGTHRGDTVTVTAGDSALGEARRVRVSETLQRMGLAVRPDSAAVTSGSDSVVVLVPKPSSTTPADCQQWQVLGGGDPLNASAINFGCATRASLYLMVADPGDLVAGRVPGPGDAEPGMRAVRRYREGPKPAGEGAAGGESGATAATGATQFTPTATPTSNTGGGSGQP
jgi:pilus assembly protein CpaD